MTRADAEFETSPAGSGEQPGRARPRSGGIGPAFRPQPWTVGAHRQTLLGYLSRRGLRWPGPVEELVVDAGGDVRLLCLASWQPGARREQPALVLVHGLGGGADAGYMVAVGWRAWQLGWHVVRMNLRGAGASEPLCPRLYNAGLTADLLAVLRDVAQQARAVALAGFSLGANLALLAASRDAHEAPRELLGVAAVSPPTDLSACADRLDARDNRLYRHYFMANLRAAYRRRQARLPGSYAAGRERGLRSIRGYDEAITAPYGGFRDAADYYARSSAGPHLRTLAYPTLMLSAADDPLIPTDSVTRWPLPTGTPVLRELLPTGGHLGFVAKSHAPGRFWAADRVVAWLDERAQQAD